MELSRKSFLIFTTFAGIYIFIMLLLCLQVSHFNNECEHSRSEGKPKKYCYHDNLHCKEEDVIAWKFEVNKDEISFRTVVDQENIFFGDYLEIGICYGACPPATGCHYFDEGKHTGYCIEEDSNIIYSQPRFMSAEGTVMLMSDLINRYKKENNIPDIDFSVTQRDQDPFFEFVNSISPDLSSSSGSNGIFGNKIKKMSAFKDEKRSSLAVSEFLLNTNEILRNTGGFEDITSLDQAKELEKNFFCVDPGFIFPCNGRKFVKDKNKYCNERNGSYTDCVCFCSYDTTNGNFNSAVLENSDSDTFNGIKNRGSKEGFYQTTGIGLKLEQNTFKIKPGNLINNYSIGPAVPGQGGGNFPSLGSAYIQDRVFCGGNKEKSTNNFNKAEDSKFPTPPIKGKGFFGF